MSQRSSHPWDSVRPRFCRLLGWRGIKQYVSVQEVKLMAEAAGGELKRDLTHLEVP